jgi:nucleotide-binding universal stress UspA family protein
MRNTSQVVIGFDFTLSSRRGLERGLEIAARAPSHVLHVVCVIERDRPMPGIEPGPVDYQYAQRVQEAIAHDIENLLRAAAIVDRVHFFVHARIGKAADEILAVARDVGADLILMGTKGLTGVTHLMVGSVAERVVREAGCTVEIVRAKTYADVQLLNITTTEPTNHYVPPHRYSYEDRRVTLRPDVWPLY